MINDICFDDLSDWFPKQSEENPQEIHKMKQNENINRNSPIVENREVEKMINDREMGYNYDIITAMSLKQLEVCLDLVKEEISNKIKREVLQ
jgi:hypothetical protein